jgi:hypothetical protein
MSFEKDVDVRSQTPQEEEELRFRRQNSRPLVINPELLDKLRDGISLPPLRGEHLM